MPARFRTAYDNALTSGYRGTRAEFARFVVAFLEFAPELRESAEAWQAENDYRANRAHTVAMLNELGRRR